MNYGRSWKVGIRLGPALFLEGCSILATAKMTGTHLVEHTVGDPAGQPEESRARARIQVMAACWYVRDSNAIIRFHVVEKRRFHMISVVQRLFVRFYQSFTSDLHCSPPPPLPLPLPFSFPFFSTFRICACTKKLSWSKFRLNNLLVGPRAGRATSQGLVGPRAGSLFHLSISKEIPIGRSFFSNLGRRPDHAWGPETQRRFSHLVAFMANTERGANQPKVTSLNQAERLTLLLVCSSCQSVLLRSNGAQL